MSGLGWTLLLRLAVAGSDPPEATTTDWLQWDAPDGCPSNEYVREATAERLGRVPRADDIMVTATIVDHGPEGLALGLSTVSQGHTDTRELMAHDCFALGDAAALVIAIEVDAMAVTERLSAPLAVAPANVGADPGPSPRSPVQLTPEPSPPPASQPTMNLASPPASAVARPASDRAEIEAWTLALAGGLELGAVPGVSGGPSVWGAMAWPRLRLELGGAYIAPQTRTTERGSVRVQLGAASARVCARPRARRVEFPLCAGLELGGARGRGQDVPGTQTVTGLWIAPTATFGVHGWIGDRLALVGRAEVAVAARRPAFELRDPGEPLELFRPAAASGRLWVGIEGKIFGARDGSGRHRRRGR